MKTVMVRVKLFPDKHKQTEIQHLSVAACQMCSFKECETVKHRRDETELG